MHNLDIIGNKIDSLIFDVDGTLWDSTAVAAAAYNRILEQKGIHLSVRSEDLKRLFGLPMNTIAEKLMPEINPGLRESIALEMFDYEKEYIRINGAVVYDGVHDTIRSLSGKYKLFILSNCQKGYIELMMEQIKIQKYITSTLCFGDTGLGKADNLKILIYNNGLKLPYYVGDTTGDLEACRMAGVPMIHARYGFGKKVDSVAYIDSFSDLLSLA
jgi:phosphoglycolate phosphatase